MWCWRFLVALIVTWRGCCCQRGSALCRGTVAGDVAGRARRRLVVADIRRVRSSVGDGACLKPRRAGPLHSTWKRDDPNHTERKKKCPSPLKNTCCLSSKNSKRGSICEGASAVRGLLELLKSSLQTGGWRHVRVCPPPARSCPAMWWPSSLK